MEEEGIEKKEGLDFFNPAIVMALLMAVMSDAAIVLTFIFWFIPVVGLVIAALVIGFHYLAAFFVGFLIFPKITKGSLLGNLAGTALLDVRSAMLLIAKILLILAMILPFPLLTIAIIIAIILANKLVEAAASVALVIATGGGGAVAEVAGGAVAKGATAAVEAGAEAAAGAAEAAEVAAETAEVATKGARGAAGTAKELAKEEAQARVVEEGEERTFGDGERGEDDEEAREKKKKDRELREALGEEPEPAEELERELLGGGKTGLDVPKVDKKPEEEEIRPKEEPRKPNVLKFESGLKPRGNDAQNLEVAKNKRSVEDDEELGKAA